MKYTGGEWHARVIDKEWSITSDIGRIARLGKNTDRYPESEANAQLMAAAPNLLKACRGLLDMVTDNRTHGVEIDAACEALSKADGNL